MISHAVIIRLLRSTNVGREAGWIDSLIGQVQAHPRWHRIVIDPARDLDPAYLYFEDDDANVVDEYAQRGVKHMPPIILVPADGEYPWKIIDGAHRAAAAMLAGKKLAAYVPAKGWRR